MKKLILSFVILVSIIAYVYILINGSPWGRYKFRTGANLYLKNKYMQEMSISEIHFSFKDGDYWATANPKGLDKIKFRVEPLKNKREFKDNYFISAWEHEVGSQLIPYVQRTFSKNDYAYIKIPTNPLYDIYHEKVDKVPSFREVRDKIKDTVIIRIVLARKFEQNNADVEYKKMIEIIDFIKKRQFMPDEIDFSFNSNLDDPQNWTTFRCSYRDLEMIQSFDQLKQHLNQVKD